MDSDADSDNGGGAGHVAPVAAAAAVLLPGAPAFGHGEPWGPDCPFMLAYSKAKAGLQDTFDQQWTGELRTEPSEMRATAILGFHTMLDDFLKGRIGRASDRRWRKIRALIRRHPDVLAAGHLVRPADGAPDLRVDDFAALDNLITHAPRAAIKIIKQNAAYLIERFASPQLPSAQYTTIVRAFEPTATRLSLNDFPGYARKLITLGWTLASYGFAIDHRAHSVRAFRLPDVRGEFMRHEVNVNRRLAQFFRELEANRELAVSRVAILQDNKWGVTIPPGVLAEIMQYSVDPDNVAATAAPVTMRKLSAYLAARDEALREVVERRRRTAAKRQRGPSPPPPLVDPSRDEI